MEQYLNNTRSAQGQWSSSSESSSIQDCDLEAEKEQLQTNQRTDAMQDPETRGPEMCQQSRNMKTISSQNHIVDFDGPNDPENPKNWSRKRKWAVTGGMGGMTFVVTFASSVFVRLPFPFTPDSGSSMSRRLVLFLRSPKNTIFRM